MKRGAKLTLILSILFFLLFALGITEGGQKLLRGKIRPNATHGELDDIYMGAGLVPWVYGLVPCVSLALLSAGLFVGHRVKHGSRR